MRQTDFDKIWDYFGQHDPYWGVVTAEQYRSDMLTDEEKRRFFDTGSDHVSDILNKIRSHVDAGFQIKHALDFGCGVGRILIPLARISDHVTGVDVSASILKEAERNCRDQCVTNVTFVLNDDNLTKLHQRRFDFVHSYIVLQHIPPKVGIKLIDRLLEMVNDKGIAVLQVTYFDPSPIREQWRVKAYRNLPFLFAIRNVFKGRPAHEPLMPMNPYDMNTILHCLQRRNYNNVWFEFTNHNYWGVTLFCQRNLTT
jgi:SAM-dependent methyltransferase